MVGGDEISDSVAFSTHNQNPDGLARVSVAQGVWNQTKRGSSLALPPTSNVTTQGRALHLPLPMCVLLGVVCPSE